MSDVAEAAVGEGAQGGHVLWPVPGPDLAGVLAEGDVADVVQGFDAPVAAHDQRQPAR
ncbi:MULTISPECIES: hypothetical protein [Streptomyces]|uniref:hypothetical protein n=1 Tax=Streptomyces TaxID=1883 RepID=UPI00131BDE96|nr:MULTISPECIES: hypothetical protein [Streptomyces]MDI5911632.1 hypothetical protein [Streptomyces sp. 12257]